MEKKIDIIPFLEGIVEKNTQSYQSDFEYDKDRLQAAMLETAQEDRTFLWMSRPCGTWCFSEREIFLRDTPAHTTWTHGDYIAEASQIKAFRIIVAPGYPGAFVLGKIQPLNYGEQVQRVLRSAIQAQAIDITFEDSTALAMPYQEYSKQSYSLIDKHGKIERVYFRPENEDELRAVLQTERMISTAKKRPQHKPKKAAR